MRGGVYKNVYAMKGGEGMNVRVIRGEAEKGKGRQNKAVQKVPGQRIRF